MATVRGSEESVPKLRPSHADHEGRQVCVGLFSARLLSSCAELRSPSKYRSHVIQDPKTRRAGTQGRSMDEAEGSGFGTDSW